jgi:hypothetical protein
MITFKSTVANPLPKGLRKIRKKIFCGIYISLFSETTTILRRRIHRVTIETDILGSHFSIYFFGDTSFGNQVISGKHFKKSDVREIQRILIG